MRPSPLMGEGEGEGDRVAESYPSPRPSPTRGEGVFFYRLPSTWIVNGIREGGKQTVSVHACAVTVA